MEKQLGGVGKFDLRDLRLVFATFTFKGVVSQVGDGDDSAQIANMHAIRIRDFKQPFSQELSGSVGDLTIYTNIIM